MLIKCTDSTKGQLFTHTSRGSISRCLNSVDSLLSINTSYDGCAIHDTLKRKQEVILQEIQVKYVLKLVNYTSLHRTIQNVHDEMSATCFVL